MSSGESIFIIILILVIIAGVASAVIINKRFNHQIALLDRECDQLNDIEVKEDIKRLEKMDLAGKSLETFQENREAYQRVNTEKVGVLRHLLEEAAAANAKYSLIKAHKYIKEVQEIYAESKDVVENSKKILKDLLESNKDNQKKYASLFKTYQEQRKSILANSFKYGTALDELEKNLSLLEKQFEAVKNLSNQGDHVEAKNVLDEIQVKLNDLKDELPNIQEADDKLKNIFPDQLDEITHTYNNMIKDKYMINEVDVLETVKSLREKIDDSKNKLATLELDAVKKQDQAIEIEIDDLYDILTKEFKAKPFVDKNRDKLLDILSHMRTSSSKLVAKLEHIDESYELNHGELKEGKELESRVNHLNTAFDTDCQKLTEGKGVYSEIETKWLAMLKELDQIDVREKQISDKVDGLFDAEKIANDSINQFKQSVSLIYRKVERRQLPGKPEGFVQLYTLVIKEISETSEELNQVRINLEKISHELIQIQEDIDRLQKEAEEILNSADLFELTMQYSNKYSSRKEIERARKEAYDLYKNKYAYKDALDVIATALEKAEPGAYQRIEKEYYAELNEESEDE